MDDYRIIKKLGRGAQGRVQLAEHKLEGKKYVLKKIECKDENEANKAFREAQHLKKLSNTYICAYKEMFVYWDKDDSSMYVCIAMDFYSNGDLHSVLKKYHETKENLREITIKKWLGQILEALVYIHKKGIIHRDLKPSNIFIQDDNSLSIGDFGVATVIEDVRTKARSPVGTTTWMAPEVLNKAYDERTDIWSVGCIIFEMLTCTIIDSTEITGKLYEIKQNPKAVKEILDQVKDQYSEQMIELVSNMLTIDFHQRPTTSELLKVPYVKECLLLSGSTLAEKRDVEYEISVPKGEGFDAVIDFLTLHAGNESNALPALTYLVELTELNNGDGIVDYGKSAKELITKATKLHPLNVEIQVAGCQTILNMISSANIDDILYSRDTISLVLSAMKKHSNSLDIQLIAIKLLGVFAVNDEASKFIGDSSGIKSIIEAMRAFESKTRLLSIACEALWNLTVNEENCRLATELEGVLDVIKTLDTQGGDTEAVENASAALLALSLEDENQKKISDADCVGKLVKSLSQHKNCAKVVKNACMTLASLVEADEESAYRVLSNESGGNEVRGLPLIIDAYEQHKDNAVVVENICTLFMELSEYDEICAEMKYLKIGDSLLSEVHRRFKDSVNVMKPCESALSKLLGGKIRVPFASES
ncbi:unnamed protein product [Dimorphilus gyrociliatus]|uniref:non-specific serine/threonine protein kinase n=1 Tax=Dimorphilus gyrociliatus TaxID=2664684 RepID=A0A7I8VL74_9ANNE|nr:unnamed protein product [Dimorphilus gyrociliatus]